MKAFLVASSLVALMLVPAVSASAACRNVKGAGNQVFLKCDKTGSNSSNAKGQLSGSPSGGQASRGGRKAGGSSSVTLEPHVCALAAVAAGGWFTGRQMCFGFPSQPNSQQPAGAQQGPTLEEILVAARSAIGEMTIPAPPATVQPGTTALIHVPTNFYCDPSPSTLNTTVLGIPITAVVTPQSFTWETGDGGQVGPTSDPGRPYPDLRVTYTYQRTGQFPVSLQTTYTATVTIPGQGTYPVPGIMLTTRIVTTLTVKQAPVQHIDATP